MPATRLGCRETHLCVFASPRINATHYTYPPRIFLFHSSSWDYCDTCMSVCTSASVCNTYRCVYRCNTYRCVSLHPTHVYPQHTFASPRIHATHVYLQPPGLPATMQTRYNRYKSTTAQHQQQGPSPIRKSVLEDPKSLNPKP